MYRKGFAEQHPVLLGFGILFGFAMVVALWQWFLLLAVLCLIGWGLWVFTRSYDQRHLERTRHRQALAAHADYEHHLWTMGDARGFYGQFPPRMPH